MFSSTFSIIITFRTILRFASASFLLLILDASNSKAVPVSFPPRSPANSPLQSPSIPAGDLACRLSFLALSSTLRLTQSAYPLFFSPLFLGVLEGRCGYPRLGFVFELFPVVQNCSFFFLR